MRNVMVVVAVVLASAGRGAATESPRQPLPTIPDGGYKLSEPKLGGDHDSDHDHSHSPLSLLLIAGGEVGYVPVAHEINRALEVGFEVELHLGRFKAAAEASLVVNGKFQGAFALAGMGVVHPRVALGVGGVVYFGIERGVGRPSFDGTLIGLALDVVITPKLQAMCVPGALAESHLGQLGWGVGVACHVAVLLAGEPHEL